VGVLEVDGVDEGEGLGVAAAGAVTVGVVAMLSPVFGQ
jgi:hypothetical protein